MRVGNDCRYEQFEIFPETIEQELWLVDCEQRQTDRRRIIIKIYYVYFYWSLVSDQAAKNKVLMPDFTTHKVVNIVNLQTDNIETSEKI